jgi:hypothetical protein
MVFFMLALLRLLYEGKSRGNSTCTVLEGKVSWAFLAVASPVLTPSRLLPVLPLLLTFPAVVH